MHYCMSDPEDIAVNKVDMVSDCEACYLMGKTIIKGGWELHKKDLVTLNCDKYCKAKPIFTYCIYSLIKYIEIHIIYQEICRVKKMMSITVLLSRNLTWYV